MSNPGDLLRHRGASKQVPTKTKVALINMLSRAGLRTVEATSFVSPKWVPQLSDSREVMQQITREAGTQYPVLVPNILVSTMLQ